MNGVKAGGGAGNSGAVVQYKVGLVNHHGKYLTAETFGNKINASGSTLRKKQLWTVEQDPQEEDTVYIRSHLGRYLSGDKRGNATCSAEEKTAAEKFVLRYHTDGSGRWAISNRATGYYFGGTEDQIQCYEKQPGATEWWNVHLAIHPQVNLRNVNRQKYAKLDMIPVPEGRLQVTGVIPWGETSLITFEYVDGKYGIKTSDGRLLHRDGSLVDQPGPDTLFSVELKSGPVYSGMAFKDCDGKYLTAVGRDAVMQGRNKAISKDEMFIIEDSQPQVYFVAHNGKMVSIRQGIDVTANQDDELTDKETFQVEFDFKTDHLWRIRTADNKYWSLEQSGGIQSIGNGQSKNDAFTVEWQPCGALALKASNGRYVTARMNGSLYAVSDSPTEKELFYVTITNRPSLVLKCEYGFVGFRNSNNPRYECNRTTHDVIRVEHAAGKNAEYYLKGHNDRYLSVDGDGNINADLSEPWPFFIELRGQSKMAIRTAAGHYMRGEQNGTMTAKAGTELQKATFWEY